MEGGLKPSVHKKNRLPTKEKNEDYRINKARYEQEEFLFRSVAALKGNGTGNLFSTIDKLKEFNPLYINITTHHSEYVYHELDNGQFERQRVRRRPGTVAIAAAIQQRYNIPVIPHIICSGATIEDIDMSCSTHSSWEYPICCSCAETRRRMTKCSRQSRTDTPIPRN